ncbi:LysR family transcriptional regulator, partial [Serratia marcescens]
MKPTLTTSPLENESMRFRVQIKHAVAIGPGKADVLEGIAQTGSIAETGRQLRMSYQRVWSLVAAMNQDFVEPLVLT